MSKKMYNPKKTEYLAEIYRLLEALLKTMTNSGMKTLKTKATLIQKIMLRSVKRDRKLNKRIAVKMKTKLNKIANFIWEKIKSQSKVRRRPHNITTHLSGVTGAALIND